MRRGPSNPTFIIFDPNSSDAFWGGGAPRNDSGRRGEKRREACCEGRAGGPLNPTL